jgi:hypothetical protein
MKGKIVITFTRYFFHSLAQQMPNNIAAAEMILRSRISKDLIDNKHRFKRHTLPDQSFEKKCVFESV